MTPPMGGAGQTHATKRQPKRYVPDMTPPSHTTRRVLTAALLGLILPLTAACGSGATATSPTTAAGSSSTTVAPETTTSTTAATATAGAATTAYCEALRTGQADLNKISGTLNDPAAAKQGLAVLEKMAADAPAEVAPAWDDFIALIEAVTSGDTNAVAAAAAKAEPAMASIEEHAKAECGITLS